MTIHQFVRACVGWVTGLVSFDFLQSSHLAPFGACLRKGCAGDGRNSVTPSRPLCSIDHSRSCGGEIYWNRRPHSLAYLPWVCSRWTPGSCGGIWLLALVRSRLTERSLSTMSESSCTRLSLRTTWPIDLHGSNSRWKQRVPETIEDANRAQLEDDTVEDDAENNMPSEAEDDPSQGFLPNPMSHEHRPSGSKKDDII